MANTKPQKDPFRAILPRAGNIDPPRQPPNSPPIVKRTTVIAACEACRRRKGKCDAMRPKCSPCYAAGRECVYQTDPAESRGSALKRKFNQLEQHQKSLRKSIDVRDRLIHAIQSRPETDAAAIFGQLRHGVDVESIMQLVESGDLLLQLQASPKKSIRYELPYQRTMITSSVDHPFSDSVSDTAFQTSSPERQANFCPLVYHYASQYTTPQFPAKIMDSRLESVKPSEWTSVSSDDALMRSLLELFFLHDYNWFTCFHKDHFLDDMCSGSNQYCSSGLVNAVLALACYCNYKLPGDNQFWTQENLGQKFLAEAESIWETEKHTKALPTLQAALMINMIMNMSCSEQIGLKDKNGLKYSTQAVTMGHDLKIFECATQDISERERTSLAFTAWCLYFWTSIQCFCTFSAPIIKSLPETALPDPDQNPEWYGETWIHYSSTSTLRPMNQAHLFKSKCELAIIFNKIAARLFGTEATMGGEVIPLTLADFTAVLSSWYSSLPMSLTTSKIIFAPQLRLHLMHHKIMVNLYGSIIANTQPATAAAPLLDDLEWR